MWRKALSFTAGGDVKTVQPLWKTVWQFLNVLHIELPYHPEIPLLGIHPSEIKTYIHAKTCMRTFIAGLSTISHEVEST